MLLFNIGSQEGCQVLEDTFEISPSQEEGRRRWKGQEEEVVQRKDP
jgi:hypothetical protein